MKPLIALTLLVLASIACMETVATVTPTPTAQPSPTLPALTIAPLASDTPTTAPEAQTATVLQPVVNVRETAGGAVVRQLKAGDVVTVLEREGDWVRIKKPAGWVWVGCLEGLSDKGCEAK